MSISRARRRGRSAITAVSVAIAAAVAGSTLIAASHAAAGPRTPSPGPGAAHGLGQLRGLLPADHLTERSALQVDLTRETVRLPLYPGTAHGKTVWFVLLDASDKGLADDLGVNYAPKLANAGIGCPSCVETVTEASPTPQQNRFGPAAINFQDAPDFSPTRVAVPGPQGFPLAKFQPGAVGGRHYSPFIRINGSPVVYNAPIVAVGDGPFDVTHHTNTADRVLGVHLAAPAPGGQYHDSWVDMLFIKGFDAGQPIVYLSTDAGQPLTAVLERATYAPALNRAPYNGGDDFLGSARERLFGFINGQTGTDNPQAQGFQHLATDGLLSHDASATDTALIDALRNGGDLLNVFGDFPTLTDPRHANAYSPLWDAQLGLWTPKAVQQGLNARQIDENQVLNLAASRPDLLTGVNPATGKPAPYGSVGVDINCAVMGYTAQPPTAALAAPATQLPVPAPLIPPTGDNNDTERARGQLAGGPNAAGQLGDQTFAASTGPDRYPPSSVHHQEDDMIGAQTNRPATGHTPHPGALPGPIAVRRGPSTLRRRKKVWAGLAAAVTAAGFLTYGPPAAAATPTVTPGQLNAVVALSPTNAWAVGLTQESTVLVEHWNGRQWSPVTAPNPGYVNRFAAVSASASDDVWAVGTQFYTGATEYYDTLVEHYDGSHWHLVPSPNFGVSSYLTGVRAIAANNVWAVGWSEQAGTGDRTLIEHWDGTAWTRVPSPNPTGGTSLGSGSYFVDTLNSVWGSGPNDVWAVGSYYPESNNYFESPLTLHWNGSTWTQVPSPTKPNGAIESYLQSVNGNTPGDADAVGAYYLTHWVSLIEHWNGTSWQVVPSPNPPASSNTQLLATSAFGPNKAWAVGGEVTERLTTQGWQLAANNNTGSAQLYGVAADSSTDAWAVGQAPFGELEYIVIDHWNGSTWTEQTTLP